MDSTKPTLEQRLCDYNAIAIALKAAAREQYESKAITRKQYLSKLSVIRVKRHDIIRRYGPDVYIDGTVAGG